MLGGWKMVEVGRIRSELRQELLRNSVLIPPGRFLMGDLGEGDGRPVHEVFLSDFSLTRYMITNLQFCLFLNSACDTNERGGTYLWLNTFNKMCRIYSESGRFKVSIGYENHPASGVNWHGAYSFALWVGGSLPTESQIEKAMRGGIAGARYPWGDAPPNPDLANFGENIGGTTPVGIYPQNPSGLFDIAGNLFEWCFDWYSHDAYLFSEREDPCGPKDGSDKVIRGGAWNSGAETLRCSYRDKSWPRLGRTSVGFRVAFKDKAPRRIRAR